MRQSCVQADVWAMEQLYGLREPCTNVGSRTRAKAIAVGRTTHYIHFGFYFGSQQNDPEKKLLGAGNQYRYILVTDKRDFPKTYMKKLLKEAHANAMAKVKNLKEIKEALTIVKSISANKRK